MDAIVTGNTPIHAADLSRGSILFIGNATVLVRFAGFTILTDPTFVHKHESVSIGYGMHTKRLIDPAMEIGALPPLDFIVLSHFHGDHFDQVAERELDNASDRHDAPVAKELRERGFRAPHPLKTWEEFSAEKEGCRIRITATPGRHGPPLSDLLLPEVMGSVWEFSGPEGQTLFRLYVTGDTLVIDDLKDLPRRYPEIDLALLHLGGTEVLGIMVTMDGKQGLQMMRLVNPKTAIPIHYDDYDVFKSPLSDFGPRALFAAR